MVQITAGSNKKVFVIGPVNPWFFNWFPTALQHFLIIIIFKDSIKERFSSTCESMNVSEQEEKRRNFLSEHNLCPK